MKDPIKTDRIAKFSGLAFQLLLFIAVGYFLGDFIDHKMNNETPYGVAAGCTIFLIIGLYIVIRDVIKIK